MGVHHPALLHSTTSLVIVQQMETAWKSSRREVEGQSEEVGKGGSCAGCEGGERKGEGERSRGAEAQRLKRQIEETAKSVVKGSGPDSDDNGNEAKKDRNGVKQPEKNYVIQLREFVPMAESIAKAAPAHDSSVASDGDMMEIDEPVKPTVKISIGLIKIFRRCIRARTGTREWYETRGKDEEEKLASGKRRKVDDDEDDDGRGHFTKFLWQASKVLVPVHELHELEARNFRIAKAQNDALAKDGETLKVTNAYGQLEIEVTDEDAFEAMPSVSVPASNDTLGLEKNAGTAK